MIVAENNNYISEKQLKILNFYSDGCPPCHAFMPNFIEAEKTFGKNFDFVIINVGNNMELAGEFGVRGTPTIIILDGKKVVFNQSGIPNGGELKSIMVSLLGKEVKLEVSECKVAKKKFLGIF